MTFVHTNTRLQINFDGFDWDQGNRPKCGKHGLTQEEIEAVFYDPGLMVLKDAAHSGEEDRYLAVLPNRHGNGGLFVGFTRRDEGGVSLIRPVTARLMYRKEIERYVRSR